MSPEVICNGFSVEEKLAADDLKAVLRRIWFGVRGKNAKRSSEPQKHNNDSRQSHFPI
jgi:hypothetical protein